MISFSFFALYLALGAVYGLFLFRMRQGIRLVEEDLPVYATPDAGISFPSVSVIIPLRNELARLPALLASLQELRYSHAAIEVIFIDDHSTDGTGDELHRLIQDTDGVRFKLAHLEGAAYGKKAAIDAGIAVVTGEVILTTDADCTHNPGWVESMAIPFTHGADVVAGPVVISERATLFARLQALDFLGLMGIGAGFFGIGFPRLANGANLAYRKDTFHSAGGFLGNEGISSGDDEFLLHKIVYEHGGRAVFTADPRAVVVTPPAKRLGALFLQRSRWASKGVRYSDGRFVAFLVLLFVFYCMSALLPAAAFLSPVSFIAAGIGFVLKSYVELLTISVSARLLRQPIRIIDFIIAELVHPIYLVFVTIAGTFGVGTWKGRKLETRRQEKPISG